MEIIYNGSKSVPVLDDNGVPTEMGLAVWYVYRCETFDKSLPNTPITLRAMQNNGAEMRRIVGFYAFRLHRDPVEIDGFIRLLNGSKGREIDPADLADHYELVNSWLMKQRL